MKKNLALIFLLAFLFVLLQTTVLASSNTARKYSEKPTEGTESKYLSYSKAYHYSTPDDTQNLFSTAAYGSLSSWGCSITISSSGFVSAWGESKANTIVDKIGYTLYFQQWDGYNWVDISSVSPYKLNDSAISNNHSKSVTLNNYYRVTTRNYSILGNYQDNQSATSDYILVN